jgi:hypothetical protein
MPQMGAAGICRWVGEEVESWNDTQSSKNKFNKYYINALIIYIVTY